MLDYKDSKNTNDSRHLDRVFQALAHPARRDILGRLGGGEMTISQLAEPFPMTLEAVSQHVRVLEKAALLRRTRQGRIHRCRVNPEPLRQAGDVLVQLASFWQGQLSSLERWLRESQEAK